MEIITRSAVICPECGAQAEAEMPTDACLVRFECERVTQFFGRRLATAASSVLMAPSNARLSSSDKIMAETHALSEKKRCQEPFPPADATSSGHPSPRA